MPYADIEKKKEKDKVYRENNREYFRNYAKKYYEENKEEVLRKLRIKRSKVIG